MVGTDDFIGDLLLSMGMITEEQADKARQHAEQNNVSLMEAVKALNLVANDDIMMILATEYGMETFDLSAY